MGSEGHERSSKMPHWSRDRILGKAQSKGQQDHAELAPAWRSVGIRKLLKSHKNFQMKKRRGG